MFEKSTKLSSFPEWILFFRFIIPSLIAIVLGKVVELVASHSVISHRLVECANEVLVENLGHFGFVGFEFVHVAY